MHFVINNTDLVASLAIVERAISTNDQTPALTGLHLSVQKSGLTITANNLQIAIQTKLPCNVIKTGNILLAAACLLNSFVSSQPVMLQQNGKMDRFDPFGFNGIFLHAIEGEEFPEYPVCDQKIMSLTDYELQRLIRNSAFATSNDDHQPIFSGVLMEIKDQAINFVATDSNRLSFVHAETGTVHTDSGDFIIPKANLVELGRCLPLTETIIDVFAGNNQLAFRFDDTVFVTRLIDGRFPNYRSVLYTEQKTRLIMKRSQLIQALERAALFGRVDRTPVILQIRDGVLEIETTSNLGKSQEQYSVEHQGPDEQAAYSPKFMLDMLKNMDADQVEFRLEGSRQALLKAADSDDHLYILMPIRI